MMYDLEKTSKSASSISLYVSDNPEGSDDVGLAGPEFRSARMGRLVYESTKQREASSVGPV